MGGTHLTESGPSVVLVPAPALPTHLPASAHRQRCHRGVPVAALEKRDPDSKGGRRGQIYPEQRSCHPRSHVPALLLTVCQPWRFFRVPTGTRPTLKVATEDT